MSFIDSGSLGSRFKLATDSQTHSDRFTQRGPCLLISRETGAGGHEIAQRAAGILGWRLMDKSILDQLSSQYGTSRGMLDSVDEKRINWLADFCNGLIEGHGFSQLTYVRRLHRLFEAVANWGDVVIVGRGARFILPRHSSFSVRVVAPLRLRVRRVISQMNLSDRDARKYITNVDQQRNAFLKRYFHQDVTEPDIHDLVINTEQLDIEGGTQTLIAGFRTWLDKRAGGGHIKIHDGSLRREWAST
jgi:hypothetical protein